MSMEAVARVALVHAPTPLEPLERLSAELGGPRLWIKRDDCTGLAGGGNKSRKLEYVVAAAEAAGADALLTFGALQSNHARQTAAAAARRGLACDLVLTDSVPREVDGYGRGGNLLLDALLGARIHRLEPGEEAAVRAERIIAEHAAAGRHCVEVALGASDPVGALGYVRCADEVRAQCAQADIRPVAVLHASASGGTQAGLLAGLRAAGDGLRVIGVDVWHPDVQVVVDRVRGIASATLERIAPGVRLRPADVEVLDGFLGPGYGLPSAEMVEAVQRLARSDGILLDPVYSGKAFAALLALVRAGAFAADEDVVFLHTGGTATLGVYTSALVEASV